MDDFGLNVARASLLEELGQYTEAAEVLFQEGNTLDAIRVLALDRENEGSVIRAAEILLAGLWSVLSFGVTVTEELHQSQPILGKLPDLANGIDWTGMHHRLELRDQVLETLIL